MSEENLNINGHQYQKIHLIHNTDTGAGFTALIVYALNGVRKAVENNYLPVVNFDKKTTFCFYDPEYGENVWEYFFEPVAGISYQDLQDSIEQGEISQQDIFKNTAAEVLYLHHRDKERLATFWAWEEPKNRTEWMAEKRKLGRDFIKKQIQVKPRIKDKVNTFYQQNFTSPVIIGVHIRGTDFAYAEPTSIEKYFTQIDTYIANESLKEHQIFLATDQKQFVQLFKEKYGDKIIAYDAIRSESDVSPFQFTDASGYTKGEDVLIDILLLSKCNYLFKGVAAVGEMALWFNEQLACTDFALESKFSSVKDYMHKSAYLKLNIDGKSRFSLFIRKIYMMIVRFFYTTFPFKNILSVYLSYKYR